MGQLLPSAYTRLAPGLVLTTKQWCYALRERPAMHRRAACATLHAAAQPPHGDPAAVTPEELKACFHRFQEALVSPDKLPGILADNFVAHDLPPGMDFLDFRKMVMRFIPDEAVEFFHILADGDLVSAHYMAKGTHQGDFMGIPPTGKAITFEVFEMVRFTGDGKAAERWALIDAVGLFRQVGMKQIPG